MDAIGTKICEAYATTYTYGLASPACGPITRAINSVLAPAVNTLMFGTIGIMSSALSSVMAHGVVDPANIAGEMLQEIKPVKLFNDAVAGLNAAWAAARKEQKLPQSSVSISKQILKQLTEAVWKQTLAAERGGQTGAVGSIPAWSAPEKWGHDAILNAEEALWYACYMLPDGWRDPVLVSNPDFGGHGLVEVISSDQDLNPGDIGDAWGPPYDRDHFGKGPFGLVFKGMPDELDEEDQQGVAAIIQSIWNERLVTLQKAVPVVAAAIARQTAQDSSAKKSSSSALGTTVKLAAVGAAGYGIWHFWPQILQYSLDAWKAMRRLAKAHG